MNLDVKQQQKKFRLISKLIELSEGDDWDSVKDEWIQNYRYFNEEYERCLCGKYPIVEVVVFQNNINGIYCKIGNCCEKLLLGTNNKSIYSAMKNYKINSGLLDYAEKRKYINEWELVFLRGLYRKRKLSSKQLGKFNNIKKILFFRLNKEADEWKKK